ncbi:GNAT family N-acetyltransferase [Nocardia tengchongensis]|uniref:GNAT family N-acetyltransferase n=1 Tax=Nocardia tengchongensis TaxID=2055889 RepID=UPI00369087F2
MPATTSRTGGIELHELSGARPEDLDLLRRFYAECYEAAFPDPDERESLANMESYLALKEKGWYGPNNYHIVIASKGDGIVGGSVCDYLAEPNAGVIEYLLVQPGFRGSGLGSGLLAMIEDLCRADAAQVGGRELDWLVAETEDPFRNAVPTEGFDPFTRARVMDSLGFRILDFDYVQPALSAEQEPADNLLLIARAVASAREAISTEVVLGIVAEYMRWAMRIDRPEENKEFLQMAGALSGRGSIPLCDFGEYLGWDAELRVVDVVDPHGTDLAAAITVYESAYTERETAWPSDVFRTAVRDRSARAESGYQYHLWAIHYPADESCDGMASFVTMPSAGFGGYLAFTPPLRSSGRLHRIIARIEEQMIRDNPDARGWYVECGSDLSREIFSKAGFFGIDAGYEQPATSSSGSRTPPLPLPLLYKPFGRVHQPPTLARATFLRTITEIYWAVYAVDAATDPSFARLEDSLRDCETVMFKCPGEDD